MRIGGGFVTIKGITDEQPKDPEPEEPKKDPLLDCDCFKDSKKYGDDDLFDMEFNKEDIGDIIEEQPEVFLEDQAKKQVEDVIIEEKEIKRTEKPVEDEPVKNLVISEEEE